MKSVVIEKPEQLSILDCELPQAKPNEVRIKVTYAGICGSDNHIYHGSNPFARYPRVIGHEFFGIIDAVGDQVATSRIGERVVIDPVISCGECYPCSIGLPNVCKHLQVIGVHCDGGFSEYRCVPDKNAYVVNRKITDEQATLVEPFSIAANVMKQVKPNVNDIALIYGAGPMGLIMLQVLNGVFNLSQIIIVDRVQERLDMAKTFGAHHAIDNSQTDLKTFLTDQGIEPTLIIDAACHPSILAQAMDIISPAGRIALLGFSEQPSQIIQKTMTSKQLSIFSSRLNSHCFPQVIDWMTQGLITPEKLITQRYHFKDIKQALNQFATDQRHCCKILIQFDK